MAAIITQITTEKLNMATSAIPVEHTEDVTDPYFLNFSEFDQGQMSRLIGRRERNVRVSLPFS